MSVLDSDLLAGRFRVLRQLGEGGSGIVFEAEDVERKQRVAIKELIVPRATAIMRFKQEFRVLQGLAHANLIALGELLEDRGRWFFTMELVEGHDFITFVRPGMRARDFHSSTPLAPPTGTMRIAASVSAVVTPLPPLDLRRLRAALAQLASGLTAIHAASKVHRDIKPSNVRVTTEGRVVILDFGLVVESGQHDSIAEVAGTPAYMAPEQMVSGDVYPAADWYAVGALLYEALTGRVPYPGSPFQMLKEKQRGAPVPPGQLAEGVPEDLEALCLELLRPDPDARPSGREVLRRLGAEALAPSASVSMRSVTQLVPFIGRDAEIAMLGRAFDDGRTGGAVTVLVVGEPGVGKSALVRRFTEHVASTTPQAVVLAGRCYEHESVPFKAVDGLIDALARYLMRRPAAEVKSLLPGQAALLGQVFATLRRVPAIAQAPVLRREGEPQVQRAQVFEALRELLQRLCDRGPLAIVIDDLHWADQDSLTLLATVLRPPHPPPLLLCATLRPDSAVLGRVASLGDVRRLELAALPHGEACELAAALLEHLAPGDGARAVAIAREARGHPLYIDELVRHAADAPGGPDRMQLERALWARIERLDEPSRGLLRCLAVAGRPVQQQVVAAATDQSLAELARHAALLRTSSLARTAGVRASDDIEIFHDRVRDAVMAHVDEPQRREQHRRLALANEGAGRADPEVLLSHWLGAGEHEHAARCAYAAATNAEQALAFDHAARRYRQALELGHEDAPRLHLALAEALANAGRGRDAAEQFLVAAAGQPEPLALELRRRAAEQYLSSGHITEGLAALGEVLAAVAMVLPRSPRAALVALLLRRARLRVRGLGFRERAESSLAPTVLSRIDICAAAGVGLAMADTIRGADFQTRHLLLALRAGEPGRVLKALALETVFSAATDAPRRRIRQLADRVTALADRLGTPMARGWASAAWAADYFQSGEFVPGLAAADDAAAQWERCPGTTWERASLRLVATWSLYYMGRLDELALRTHRLLADARARGDLYAATNLATGLPGTVWLMADDPAAARREADQAERRWAREDWPHLQHYWIWFLRVHCDLYEGRAKVAHEAIASFWPALERSLLLRVPMVRIEAGHLRARAALALARETPDARERAALLASVERAAAHIARERQAHAAALATVLRASVAQLRGDRDAAVARFRDAGIAFEAAGLALFALASRHRLGGLLGGDEGRVLQVAAREQIGRQGVRDPRRMLELFVPGLDA